MRAKDLSRYLVDVGWRRSPIPPESKPSPAPKPSVGGENLVDLAATAERITTAAAEAGCAIVLPVDVVVAPGLETDVDTSTVAVNAVPAEAMILDVGPQSIAAINQWIDRAATLVWNGPLGAFEVPPFDAATVAAARHAAGRAKAGTLNAVAGGGDTVAALRHVPVPREIEMLSVSIVYCRPPNARRKPKTANNGSH